MHKKTDANILSIPTSLFYQETPFQPGRQEQMPTAIPNQQGRGHSTLGFQRRGILEAVCRNASQGPTLRASAIQYTSFTDSELSHSLWKQPLDWETTEMTEQLAYQARAAQFQGGSLTTLLSPFFMQV